MKPGIKQSLHLLRAITLALCPMTAWAAQLSFGEEMAAIPLMSYVATIILSTVMGLAALLHHMTEQYKVVDKIERMGLLICHKLVGSNVAGFVMFMCADSVGIPVSWKAGAIMGFAFGGTWIIERAVKHYANKHIPEQ
jgi:hypothetical protein